MLVAVIIIVVVLFLLHVQLKSLSGLGKCCYVFIITGIMREMSDSRSIEFMLHNWKEKSTWKKE